MIVEPMQDVPATAETVVIRTIREQDLEAIVDIDAASAMRRRPEYFRLIFERSVRQTAMQISLVAEVDQRVVGFVIASVYYGEFGIVEPTASIEAIGVAPDARGQHVGHALLGQLRSNLAAIGVATFRTEVAWSDFELLGFFRKEGFAPAPRLCLECRIS